MSREEVLKRIREALKDRPRAEHPGRLHLPSPPDLLDLFLRRLEENGAEGRRVARAQARAQIEALAQGFSGVAVGRGVPLDLRPALPLLPPEEAPLGLSLAAFGVAETGTVALSSADGRKAQLLPPVHLVLLERARLYPTLLEALLELEELPSALGLHSGPSKSADIGQVMVKGVHGPGRLIVLVLD
ncbi:LUD domain-containing protein [Thermus filiformis]|uniref:Lactate utilization protein B/C n=1 Tax=Thermus filiformis TaxID=276 RepID=A0A0D6X9T5_THEFI|nr:LUD domain-containing protein [Thermus filiformis]KIX84679.1 lactate utilization protein B/C [Thermus filiformis]